MESRNPLDTPLSKDHVFEVDTMRLMVAAEIDRRDEYQELPFDCTVVDVQAGEMPAFIERLREISASIGEDPARLQLIIKDDAHYLTVDFMISQQGNRFLLLDAAGDPRAHKHFLEFSRLDDMNFTPSIAIPTKLDGKANGIQTDFHSCPAFALDHACQISWMDDVYDKIDPYLDNGTVSWSRLPPELVWNAQSYTWLDNYQKLNREALKEELPFHERTFSEMLSKNVELEHPKAVRGKLPVGDSKRINKFAENSFKGYQAQTKYYIENRMPQPTSMRP